MIRYCNQIPYNQVLTYGDIKPKDEPKIDPDTLFNEIIKIVCNVCFVPNYQITVKCCKREVSEARHLAIYFIYKNVPKITLQKIGKYFDRHHATLIYSKKCAEDFRDVDPVFRAKFEKIEREVLKALTN